MFIEKEYIFLTRSQDLGFEGYARAKRRTVGVDVLNDVALLDKHVLRGDGEDGALLV